MLRQGDWAIVREFYYAKEDSNTTNTSLYYLPTCSARRHAKHVDHDTMRGGGSTLRFGAPGELLEEDEDSQGRTESLRLDDLR